VLPGDTGPTKAARIVSCMVIKRQLTVKPRGPRGVRVSVCREQAHLIRKQNVSVLLTR